MGIGASPQAVLLAKKLDLARNLLDNSSLPITDIAFSAGFQSIRRFNDAFKNRFQTTPSAVRKKSVATGGLQLKLRYRPPYDQAAMLGFLKNRAITGLEQVSENSYQRLINDGDVHGWFCASFCDDNKITVDLILSKNTNILQFVAKLKNLFDLDCDPMAIAANLSNDKQLIPWLKKHPGLRVPGTWDGFELAVRAIVGQKISVKAARTVLQRIVETCGQTQTLDASLTLCYFFPSPAQLLATDLSAVGLTQSKINSLSALAKLMVEDELLLDGTETIEASQQKLLAIKGIGAWTAEYIAMRALKDPDAFPVTDLVLQKRIKQLQLKPENWQPWRAYGAMLLWQMPGEK